MFLDWFGVVQGIASEGGFVFFICDQEGHDAFVDGVYLAEISGWLVPESVADDFEAVWRERRLNSERLFGDEWGRFFVFEDFDILGDGLVSVSFDKDDDTGDERVHEGIWKVAA